jgi:hypothetical protein
MFVPEVLTLNAKIHRKQRPYEAAAIPPSIEAGELFDRAPLLIIPAVFALPVDQGPVLAAQMMAAVAHEDREEMIMMCLRT